MPEENIHKGHRQRLRERFLSGGIESLTERETLELLLTYAIPQRDVSGLAAALLSAFGSLAGVLEADRAALLGVPGVGENAATLLSLMPALSGRYARSRMGDRPRLSDPAAAARYAASLFGGAHDEQVYLICLDLSGHVTGAPLLGRGTLDEVALYPRKVVEQALAQHAHAVLLTHNHPGGTPTPSGADVEMTRRIVDALSVVGIRVLDHLIVGRESCFSMARNGLTARQEPGGARLAAASPAALPRRVSGLGWTEEETDGQP